jgi:hypothetical protein
MVGDELGERPRPLTWSGPILGRLHRLPHLNYHTALTNGEFDTTGTTTSTKNTTAAHHT